MNNEELYCVVGIKKHGGHTRLVTGRDEDSSVDAMQFYEEYNDTVRYTHYEVWRYDLARKCVATTKQAITEVED